MSVASANVPLAIVSGIVCLAVGVGAGALGMVTFGYKSKTPPEVSGEGMPPPPSIPVPGGGGMGGGKGGGKGKGGGGGPGGAAAGRGPSPKAQLTALVAKLDQLTQKPLTVELTPDQKKAAHDALKGLADADDLSDDDAKKRLDDLLALLKDKKETLEAAGYRWPGDAPPPPRPGGPPNPFKEDANAGHLKALDARLAPK
jgi:hypothetical protein